MTFIAPLPPAIAKRAIATDGVAPSRRRSQRRLSVGKSHPYGLMLGPVLLLIFWSWGAQSGFIDPRVLPGPWVAVTTSWQLLEEGRLQANLLISAERALDGLAFGTAAGVLAALITGLSKFGGYLLDGVVQVKRSIPLYAILPFFMLWFGIGESEKIIIIAVASFMPIYLQMHTALRNIDRRYVELAESLRVSYGDFLINVVLPGALPGFFLGLRFASMASWMALVVVEQVNATAGIGYMINLATSYAQTDVMLVGLVVYAVLGVTSDVLIRTAQKLVLSWQPTLGA